MGWGIGGWVLPFWVGGSLLVCHLGLSLLVVLGQVAVLTHTVRVVRLFGMATSPSHLLFAFPVVAVVAHALSVVLLVGVRAHRNFSSFSLDSLLAALLLLILT